MTLFDLNTAGDAPSTMDSDICIVGAGAAGLYLANRLARAGLRVVILEAGGQKCLDGAEIGIEALAADAGDVYGGTTEGRAFGLGGTTSRWGGQLIPHTEADLRPPTGDDRLDAWRQIVSIVRDNADTVHRVLGLGEATAYHTLADRLLGQSAAQLRENGLVTMTSEWLPFRRRNLRWLLDQPHAKQHVSVCLHAVACRWDAVMALNGGARIDTLEARSPDGRALRVRARDYVIAAGAIESTRILLEINQQNDGRVSGRAGALGKGLSDHLSCRVAQVVESDARGAARLFGPRFRHGTMRTFKFVSAAPTPDEPRWCAHFVFDISNAGFQLARKLLGGLQRRQAPDVSLGDWVKGTAGLTRLAEHRLLRRRLFVPPTSPVYVQLNVEQPPQPCNRVVLTDELDAYGRPKAAVDWRITDSDYAAIATAAEKFRSDWPATLPRLADLSVSLHEELMNKPHDVYHPTGTCRIGSDADAVVAPDLTAQAAGNLSVLSTAVFPTAGTANPTFSMLCLAEMLSRKLTRTDGSNLMRNDSSVASDSTSSSKALTLS